MEDNRLPLNMTPVDGKMFPHGRDYGGDIPLKVRNDKGWQETAVFEFWGHFDQIRDDYWRCYFLGEDSQRCMGQDDEHPDLFGDGLTARQAWTSLLVRHAILNGGSSPAVDEARAQWEAELDDAGVV